MFLVCLEKPIHNNTIRSDFKIIVIKCENKFTTYSNAYRYKFLENNLKAYAFINAVYVNHNIYFNVIVNVLPRVIFW